jgi:hypothetical protein
VKLQSQIIDSCCFLGLEENGIIKPRATAFYAVVPFAHDRRIGRGYLVTAKHNVQKAAGRQLFVSINKQKGADRTAEWLPLDVTTWFDHPVDQAADIAVADWRPEGVHQGSYFGILTDAFLGGTGPADFEVGEGMTTATIGLFHYHPGVERHTPLVRIGSLAARPKDRVKTSLGDAEAYLIEARSVGGLSGSPVFLREETFNGFQRHSLLGLIQGHYDWKDEVAENEWQPIHTGIAVVTPSTKILETLQRPECVATRTEFNCIF